MGRIDETRSGAMDVGLRFPLDAIALLYPAIRFKGNCGLCLTPVSGSSPPKNTADYVDTVCVAIYGFNLIAMMLGRPIAMMLKAW